MSTHPNTHTDPTRERRLRHAPPRDLSIEELREAFERRMLTRTLLDVELQRREFDARIRTKEALRAF